MYGVEHPEKDPQSTEEIISEKPNSYKLTPDPVFLLVTGTTQSTTGKNYVTCMIGVASFLVSKWRCDEKVHLHY